MTEEQREAVMKRDWNTLLELGGVSYALAKLAFTDKKSYQFMASQMVGVPESEYVRDDAGRRTIPGRLALEVGEESLMAKIIAGVGTSHTPAIGAAVDNGKTAEPYWTPLFKGYEPSKKWMAETKPDVAIIVYNDHVNAFDFKIIPTFALGCGAEFPIADEGWGARPVPVVKGYPELAAHMVQSLVLDEFDMTIVNEMQVDHGLTVPMTLLFGQPQAWPVRVIPLAVNVIQYPAPTGNRCYQLGKAIKKAVESWDEDLQCRDLRHGRHVAPDPRATRRSHQQGIRHGFLERSHARSRAARPNSTARIFARRRRRGDRARDVVDHARSARRPSARDLPLLSCAGLVDGRRAHHSRELVGREKTLSSRAAQWPGLRVPFSRATSSKCG